jgi:hypothetical protein
VNERNQDFCDKVNELLELIEEKLNEFPEDYEEEVLNEIGIWIDSKMELR